MASLQDFRFIGDLKSLILHLKSLSGTQGISQLSLQEIVEPAILTSLSLN